MKLEARYSDSLRLYPLSEWSMEKGKLIQKISIIEKCRFKIGGRDYSDLIELHDGGFQPTFRMGQLIKLDGIQKYIMGIEPALSLEGSEQKVVFEYTLGEDKPETPIWWSTEIKTK